MAGSVGAIIPARLEFITPIAVVHTMAPWSWRSLAYQCAWIAQRDGRYGFASFNSPQQEPRQDEDNLRAYLLVVGTRVIGHLAATTTMSQAAWVFRTEMCLSYTDEVPGAQVELIFVAREWRRKYLGSRSSPISGPFRSAASSGC